MKTSPFFMAFLYFIMGILFTYIAILSVEETIWNLITLICSFVATVNFAVAIRLFMLYLKMNKSNKK
ncbi:MULTISPECIES: YdiK family protein [Pontibacillus]|uniref:YdiK family protein n=1 Tax=Pontibacillus chungwhensis TaxID=265426 RepID=A0ABY8V065_9BACI|nr:MULTISPECIES: YdiK family protein [Pontibacillus]MCD5325944.1 YdiK family protein [Pontibacillus sp. HN14]WIF98401.1 YdiK family protein [Pontibacillus chungwhensis]